MRAPPALLVALTVFAGCLAQPVDDPSVPYGFSGVLMPGFAADDLLELGDRARAEGGEFTIVEKVPARFSAWGLTPRSCRVVHEFAATLYLMIDTLGECEPSSIVTDEPAVIAAAQPVVPPAAQAPADR